MNFKEFTILETFHYYDGPLTFSTEIDGKLFLAHSWGTDRNEYMFFETSKEDLKELTDDKIPMRAFFRKCANNQAYRVTYSFEKDPVVEKVCSDQIEKESYMKEDVFLEKE